MERVTFINELDFVEDNTGIIIVANTLRQMEEGENRRRS